MDMSVMFDLNITWSGSRQKRWNRGAGVTREHHSEVEIGNPMCPPLPPRDPSTESHMRFGVGEQHLMLYFMQQYAMGQDRPEWLWVLYKEQNLKTDLRIY